MPKLHENIKIHRKSAGLTQNELAKLAGYTDRSSIAKIEKGQVDVPQSKLIQFAEIFGVSVSDLIGEDEKELMSRAIDVAFDSMRYPLSGDYKKESAPTQGNGLSDSGYNKLTPDNQKMIDDLIEKLLRSQSES